MSKQRRQKTKRTRKPVRFSKILFRNGSSNTVTLTVEAPIGKVVSGPDDVAVDSTATIRPGVDNCLSMLLLVVDKIHGIREQSFAMGKVEHGWHSYLESVEAKYELVDFEGTVHARTPVEGRKSRAAGKVRG